MEVLRIRASNLAPAQSLSCSAVSLGLAFVVLGALGLGLRRQLRWPQATQKALLGGGMALTLVGLSIRCWPRNRSEQLRERYQERPTVEGHHVLRQLAGVQDRPAEETMHA